MSQLIYNFFNPAAARVAVPFLVGGVFVTLQVSVVSVALASTLGLVVALARRAAPVPLRWALIGYVDILRAMPPVVLMILVYFALPTVGVNLAVFPATVATLSLYSSAYVAEIFRGAFEGIPAGQRDAARGLGLTPLQTMWYVILPQAFRIAIPPLTNEAIGLVKSTSLGFVIGLPELLGQARSASALTANTTPLIAGAFLYLVLLLFLSRLSQMLERHTKHGVVYARA